MNEQGYREAERRFWEWAGLTPQETFVTLPRLRVSIRIQMVGEGEPVLFIHGGPNAGSTWIPMLERLSGFRALLVDRPGTGLSDVLHVGRHDLADFGRVFVGDVAAALGMERLHVVASSFGGYLAIQSAAAEPERIARMVQMACPAFVAGMQVPAFMRLLTVGPVRRLTSLLPPSRRAQRAIFRQIGHGASLEAGRIPEALFDWYEDLARHTDTMDNESRMIARLASLRGFDPALTIRETTLAQVSAAALFLWGRDDPFGDEAVARRLVSAMPDAGLVMLPASGHLPWCDDPHGVAQATAAFLHGEAPPPAATAVGAEA